MSIAICASPVKTWLKVAMLCSIASLSGCDFSNRIPVQPIVGQVLWQGKPMAHAIVMLHATSDTALLPLARTDEEGRFQLTTYDEHDGAPVGEYVVTIEWPAQIPHPDGGNARPLAGPDQLNGQYADPQTSSLRLYIVAGQTQLPPLMLR